MEKYAKRGECRRKGSGRQSARLLRLHSPRSADFSPTSISYPESAVSPVSGWSSPQTVDSVDSGYEISTSQEHIAQRSVQGAPQLVPNSSPVEGALMI